MRARRPGFWKSQLLPLVLPPCLLRTHLLDTMQTPIHISNPHSHLLLDQGQHRYPGAHVFKPECFPLSSLSLVPPAFPELVNSSSLCSANTETQVSSSAVLFFNPQPSRSLGFRLSIREIGHHPSPKPSATVFLQVPSPPKAAVCLLLSLSCKQQYCSPATQ